MSMVFLFTDEPVQTHDQVFIEPRTKTTFKEKSFSNVKICAATKDCVTLQNMGSKVSSLLKNRSLLNYVERSSVFCRIQKEIDSESLKVRIVNYYIS